MRTGGIRGVFDIHLFKGSTTGFMYRKVGW
jgi:hypothetical protein